MGPRALKTTTKSLTSNASFLILCTENKTAEMNIDSVIALCARRKKIHFKQSPLFVSIVASPKTLVMVIASAITITVKTEVVVQLVWAQASCQFMCICLPICRISHRSATFLR